MQTWCYGNMQHYSVHIVLYMFHCLLKHFRFTLLHSFQVDELEINTHYNVPSLQTDTVDTLTNDLMAYGRSIAHSCHTLLNKLFRLIRQQYVR